MVAAGSPRGRRRGPSVRQIREGPSPISPRSPLWVENEEEDEEVQYNDLNLDCGSKQSIARSVAMSPQRYSGAFSSQVRASRRAPGAASHCPQCIIGMRALFPSPLLRCQPRRRRRHPRRRRRDQEKNTNRGHIVYVTWVREYYEIPARNV